jgi:hypothetical protein
MNPAFIALCIVHIVIWAFVLFAFLNPKLAAVNLFYVVPLIYIIHVFPLHFLNKAKESMYPDDWEKRADMVCESLIIPKIFVDSQRQLETYSFASPISPQGMLIFGAVSSAWALRFEKRFK